MVDESASIRASGLQPNQRVTIRAELVDGADVRWTSEAEFVADGQGRIDTSRHPALAGSYKGVSASGLIWSMIPSSKKASRYQPPRDFGIQTIDFHLMDGKVESSSARLEQASIAEGVQRVIIRYGDLRATLFSPPGKDRRPGILVLGGSEGGLPSRRAAWLASHGFAARAASFSTRLYSVSVVAPMQRRSPRARAGFNMLAASIAPSAEPAPTSVCSSSMKQMISPLDSVISLRTAFRRSSNSPRNLVPATMEPRSSATSFLCCN